MPKNDLCGHRGCDGGPCRMLTEAELEPSAADMEEARRMIAEGWESTSNKYRSVARFAEPIPTIESMVSYNVLDTFHGKRLADCWRKCHHGFDLRCGGEGVERRDLSIQVYRAFKKLGGPTA